MFEVEWPIILKLLPVIKYLFISLGPKVKYEQDVDHVHQISSLLVNEVQVFGSNCIA